MTYKRGILWAFGTAVVSGVSIYVNKFGVAQVSDPFVYTTVKNTIVAVGFLAAIAALLSWREFRGFTARQWIGWLALGLIGGGIPFLLFFQGLATASAPSAALIQKSLFLWVALLALPLLGEKLGTWQVIGLVVIAAGEFLLQIPSRYGWGTGETLILIATLMWAVETIIAKRVLAGMSARVAALGRMGVGAVVMWGFLAFTGRAGSAFSLTAPQWFWVVVTAAFLMAYVWSWYSALKFAPATLVTTVLTLGLVVTLLLTDLLDLKRIMPTDVWGIVLMSVGVVSFILSPVRRWIGVAEAQ